MQPFQAVLHDFLKTSSQIIEEFQAQCQAIAYEVPDLDLTKELPAFKFYPGDTQNEELSNASASDIENEVINVYKKSPKELLLSSHFTTKVKNSLNSSGLTTTKVQIRKAIEKLKAEGKVKFPDQKE